MTERPRILFIDDDRDFLAAQEAFFAARGCDVRVAETTTQALGLVAECPFDIIFVDLMMEHADSGFVLSYRLRQRPELALTPIIMLSGVAAATGQRFDGDAASLKTWSKLDAFVNKPVTGRQLVRVVEERLGRTLDVARS